jgi:hypothetical protein
VSRKVYFIRDKWGVFYPANFADIAVAITVRMILARSLGWTIRPTGNTTLNALGLLTKIPTHRKYLSDGPYRTDEWLVMKKEINVLHS